MFGQTFWSFAIVVVGLVCGNVCAGMSPEDEATMEAVKKYIMECAKEFGITEEQVEEMHKNQNAIDVEPCYVSCFFKKVGIFDSKGMFDIVKAMENTKAHTKDEKKMAIMNKIKQECASVNDVKVSDGDKGCERAVLLSKCFKEHKDQLKLEE